MVVGRWDAEILYADYIEGKRSYMDITLEIINRSIRSKGKSYTFRNNRG